MSFSLTASPDPFYDTSLNSGTEPYDSTCAACLNESAVRVLAVLDALNPSHALLQATSQALRPPERVAVRVLAVRDAPPPHDLRHPLRRRRVRVARPQVVVLLLPPHDQLALRVCKHTTEFSEGRHVKQAGSKMPLSKQNL